MNAGLLKDIEKVSNSPIEALEKAFKKIPAMKKCVIAFTDIEDILLSDIQVAFPRRKFLEFSDPNEFQEWQTSDKNYFLVYVGNGYELSGLEFDSMICIFWKCRDCGDEDTEPLIITRAKASLVVAKYSKPLCHNCLYRIDNANE